MSPLLLCSFFFSYNYSCKKKKFFWHRLDLPFPFKLHHVSTMMDKELTFVNSPCPRTVDDKPHSLGRLPNKTDDGLASKLASHLGRSGGRVWGFASNKTIRWLIEQSNNVWVRLVILPPNTSMLYLSSLFLKVGICYSPHHIRPWIQLIWGNNDELKTWSKQALIFTILSRKKKWRICLIYTTQTQTIAFPGWRVCCMFCTSYMHQSASLVMLAYYCARPFYKTCKLKIACHIWP
jgi:hypothetical protein